MTLFQNRYLLSNSMLEKFESANISGRHLEEKVKSTQKHMIEKKKVGTKTKRKK